VALDLLSEDGLGLAKSGTIDGTREMAIAACRAAIDKWLGPKN